MSIKKVILALMAIISAISLNACGSGNSSQKSEESKTSKTLIVYYSWSGNTKKVAEQIQALTGGDLFEIQPVNPYPTDYKQCIERAKEEINAGFLPELKSLVENFSDYDTIFIGSPNWWGTIAPPVLAFLAQHDFSGKTVFPFITHGSGGKQRCFDDFAKALKDAKVLEGFAVHGTPSGADESEIEKWLKNQKNND